MCANQNNARCAAEESAIKKASEILRKLELKLIDCNRSIANHGPICGRDPTIIDAENTLHEAYKKQKICIKNNPNIDMLISMCKNKRNNEYNNCLAHYNRMKRNYDATGSTDDPVGSKPTIRTRQTP